MSFGSVGSSPETHDLTIELLIAVADARDEEVGSLPPLAHALDPDALERFVESTTVPTTITLDLYGCTVEVDADGTVAATLPGVDE